jgi:Divergent InlB B-repeat domain/S-layer homology domain
VTLTAVVGSGYHLVSWTIDGKASGWAKEITLTMDTAHTVIATFRTGTSFSDLLETNVARQAVLELAARNTVRGYGADICAERGLAAPCFGPDDSTLRAQMAALIARAMGWDAEDWRNDFADRGPIDADLWRNVGTLAHYNVARGYGDGSYDPTGPVLSAQTISFITRSMVAKGYWVQQNDDPALYPNIPASSGHRADIATYVHYAGALPDAPALTSPFAAWDQASTRGWFARALWQALDAYFGSDRPDTGGFVP